MRTVRFIAVVAAVLLVLAGVSFADPPRKSDPTGSQAKHIQTPGIPAPGDPANSYKWGPKHTTSKTTTNSPFAPANPGPAELTVAEPIWVSPSKHKQNDAIVQTTLKSTGYSGPVRVQVFQTAVIPEGPLGPSVRALGPATTVQLEANGSVPVEVRVSGAPSRIGRGSSYHVVAEAKGKYSEAVLPVSDPTQLSVELDAADPLGDPAPLSDTPQDRVFLWLRRHRDAITRQAAEYKPKADRTIPPEAIAGAIAWEALFNVATIRHYQGPGKVHFDDGNAAEQVEKLGYVPGVLPIIGASERLTRVRDTGWAIKYIAAIMGAYADLAEQAGSRADIRNTPEILATLFNGIFFDKALIPGAPMHPAGNGKTDIRLDNAPFYFDYKVKHGDSYAPSEKGKGGVIGMGLWVQKNTDYLKEALSNP